MNTLDFISQNKVITICRRVYGEDLLKLADALYAGGIKMIEVTFDQADPDCIEKTGECIRALCDRFGDKMMFGAGTVLNAEQVEAAAKAGARYIISPNVDADVIAKTKELGLVSMPGAMTPSEILTAHKLGADIVKVSYTGDMESFADVVSGCCVPVVIAGGERMDSTRQVLRMVYDSIKAGGAGVSMGRNVFQHPRRVKLMRALRAIVHENSDVDQALAIVGE